MAELTAEIRARFDQVQRELQATNKEAAKLERELNRVGAAARGADGNFKVMAGGVDDASEAMQTLNRSAGKSSAVFFQAGQAVSDFAVAGILGAANNIELLAFQLGASGPLIAGITALSVAALVFRDDIEAAFAPLKTITRDTEEAVSDLLKVIGGKDVNLLLLEDQIPAALNEQKRIVEELSAEYDALLPKINLQKALLGEFLFDLTGGIRLPFIVDITETEKNLAQAKGTLEALEAQLEDVENTEKGFAAGTKNAFVAVNNEIEQSIRLSIERMGLSEEISKISSEELFDIATKGDLEKFIADLKEKQNRSSKEGKSLLEQSLDTNRKLKETLESLRNLDTDRLGQILLQNNGLREQIKIVQRIAEEQAKAAKIIESSLGGFQKAGAAGLSQQGAVTSIEDVISDINKRRSKDKRNRLGLPSILDPNTVAEVEAARAAQISALEGIISGANRTEEAFKAAGITANEFYFSTKAGAVIFAEEIGNLAGGISQAFEGAYQLAGQKQGIFFASFKAFSIAEATISAFVAANKALATGGPILGPIQAAAIYAAAIGNVARIAAIKPGGGAGAGGAVGGNIPQTVANDFGNDPRRGRQGFRRDGFESAEPGYNPISSLAQFSVPEFTFRIMGEDLVAVSDKNTRRQSRTRGR